MKLFEGIYSIKTEDDFKYSLSVLNKIYKKKLNKRIRFSKYHIEQILKRMNGKGVVLYYQKGKIYAWATVDKDVFEETNKFVNLKVLKIKQILKD